MAFYPYQLLRASLDRSVVRVPLFKLFSAAAVVAALMCSATLNTIAEDKLNLRIVQSGHSLTDPIPGPLRAFAISAGAKQDVVIDASTIPGSPMEWRWDNEPYPGTPDARKDISKYDMLVLTERVPLSNTMPWHHSYEEALRWYEHAYTNGADGKGAETLLYATWVDIDSGPDAKNEYGDPERHLLWRDRLPLEFSGWLEIADFVNSNRPEGAAPMRIIPATLVLAAAYDDIIAGKAPGITDISQLFQDNIHVNEAGAYLVALVHYAVIYGLDPRGLPNDIGQSTPLSAEMASWMQTLVSEVVANYQAAAGLSLSPEELQACLWADLRGSAHACS